MIEVIKWTGTVFVILAACFRAADIHFLDLITSILGAGLWGYAAYQMKDKALIVVNIFIAAILLVGLING